MFLDFQRDNAKRQGLPVQNGVPHAEAGDKLSEEASFLKNSNDPAGEDASCYCWSCSVHVLLLLKVLMLSCASGFNLIDVFAWGAIGHALGYAALAIISLNSLGVNPAPKF